MTETGNLSRHTMQLTFKAHTAPTTPENVWLAKHPNGTHATCNLPHTKDVINAARPQKTHPTPTHSNNRATLQTAQQCLTN